MPWYHRPSYGYDSEGYEFPFQPRREETKDPLKELKRAMMFAQAWTDQYERKAKKKKKEDDDKKKPDKIPTFTVGQVVGILMISWPFIGMFEKWAIQAVFH